MKYGYVEGSMTMLEEVCICWRMYGGVGGSMRMR